MLLYSSYEVFQGPLIVVKINDMVNATCLEQPQQLWSILPSLIMKLFYAVYTRKREVVQKVYLQVVSSCYTMNSECIMGKCRIFRVVHMICAVKLLHSK